ncbi:thiazole biosynthesis protein [Fervidicoccus fontis]|uniref:Thiamine thiazole synthase n=2 Tax=Fervidicoccus fontis TaxID=683846 RepID=I0A075_FERFK|nr:sulfide-dependent adenosine diphosphate thiazole synthase [Fervidicoccus fontis]AFH42382.1 putative thiazole biosynthetic enzyme [Fervidicoccus fontis Kam940]MBE9391691.1 thiazole biosynthesis protein [Fervidicoccus fontis]PMB76120.1 MAG: ribose 1,5-bisphosphate isomerase [Fervidicoccus fontis]PMB77647.1 MAG: ribose 1,5-bisphosphate isomerase [Fervidicoccus fontis]
MSENLEFKITKLILEHSMKDLIEFADSDVIIVGAGPSGMTAAKYLADKKLKVLVLERKLSFGGGIGGGGNLMHKIVIKSDALKIIKDFEIEYKKTEFEDLYTLDASELISKLATGAINSGAKILFGYSVEDLIVREKPLRVSGVVVKWSAIDLAQLHVDPIFFTGKAILDATGHDAELIKILAKKNPSFAINVKNESSAHAELGEKQVVEFSGKVCDGLYAAGMSVATLHGLYRMGPIFSGMLISGKKVAELISKELGK